LHRAPDSELVVVLNVYEDARPPPLQLLNTRPCVLPIRAVYIDISDIKTYVYTCMHVCVCVCAYVCVCVCVCRERERGRESERERARPSELESVCAFLEERASERAKERHRERD
jgi:hypothetical protein